MRKLLICLTLLTCCCFAEENEQDFKPLTEQELKTLSEAFGHFIGKTVLTPGVHFDLESLIKGMRDEVNGIPSPLSEKETEEQMMRMQMQAVNEVAKENLEKAEEFLGENVNAEGVIVLVPEKLQALVLQKGYGDVVGDEDVPTIHFTGKYLNGETFTSTVQQGKPLKLPLDTTIPGFKQGITGMKEGEKRRLFIHPDLAYGKSGQLPPNSLLIFDIEIVKANTPDEDDAE